MAKPRRLTPEMQEAADMRELMGYPAFARFLFTIMGRSGIAASTYGTEVATSYQEGRRSLGIEILRMADETLAVRAIGELPFAAMNIAIFEGMRASTQEPETNATDQSQDDEIDFTERR